MTERKLDLEVRRNGCKLLQLSTYYTPKQTYYKLYILTSYSYHFKQVHKFNIGINPTRNAAILHTKLMAVCNGVITLGSIDSILLTHTQDVYLLEQ